MAPTESASPGTWLTQEAHDRLKAELDELIERRPVLAAEINARREEGDLRENGGYHAAKEEQGKAEARIRQLQDLLRSAKVGQAAGEHGRVVPGMVVTVRFADEEDTETFLLGSREISATTDLQVYSPESALGIAITGREPGQAATYTAPNGAQMTVHVVDVKPFVN